MSSPAQPPTTEADLVGLLLREKPIGDPLWRSRLAPRALASDPANRRGAYQFSDWVGDEWLVYSRVSLRETGNWSVGLIYDPNGINLRMVRCNGPHKAVHRNRLDPLEPAIVVTPHVHYAREKYLSNPRTGEDGYAVPTLAYSALPDAIEHLASVTNFVPEGRLFL